MKHSVELRYKACAPRPCRCCPRTATRLYWLAFDGHEGGERVPTCPRCIGGVRKLLLSLPVRPGEKVQYYGDSIN